MPQIPYLREVLEERGDVLLRDSPLIKELLTSIPNADRRQRTRPRGRPNPQRTFLGNPDLALLKAESQTHVTPLIAKLATGFFEETLQVVGQRPVTATRAEVDAQRSAALRFLKDCIARARAQEQRPAFSFPTARSHYRQSGRYAEEAVIGGETYKV